MPSKLAKNFLLLDDTVNTEYLSYTKIPKKYRVKGRAELKRILREICKEIGFKIVSNKSGVHIRKLGYFFVWKIPRKMKYSVFIKGQNVKEKYNHHTDHHMYSPIFLPSLDSRSTLKKWSMDNSFNFKVKRGISERLKSGESYKMYAHSIMKLNRI